jgi:tRNA (cytosine38-C5)-methyltransferase
VDDAALSSLPAVICCGKDNSEHRCRTISEYLYNYDLSDEELASLLIPKHVFHKDWSKDLPIVCPLDCVTHCFTAAYGRQIHRATGSLLLMDPSRTVSVAAMPVDRTHMMNYYGKLRRFSPYELLGIFGFPSNFKFPENISLEHRFKLVGNSVNVTVISHLASYLLNNYGDKVS